MNNYQNAIRYATKLIKNYNAPYSPRDLVHDAYLQYYHYQNTSLFDKEKGTVLKTIKNLHFNNKKKDTVIINGEKIQKKYIYLNDDEKNGSIRNTTNENEKYIPQNGRSPEDKLISKEIIENLVNSISEFDRKVLCLKFQGCSHNEIEKILETYENKVTKSVKRIMEKFHSRSPFNGCKVDVVKRVRRKEFETKREEYLKDWEMGEDSDYNEFYVLMTSKTNPKEGLLIKEKGSD